MVKLSRSLRGLAGLFWLLAAVLGYFQITWGDGSSASQDQQAGFALATLCVVVLAVLYTAGAIASAIVVAVQRDSAALPAGQG